MRLLFYIYSISYIAIALIMNYGDASLFISKLLFSISILIMAMPLLGPLAIMISPRLIKSHRSDPKYLNFCFVAGLFRIIFWSFGPFGLRDHMTILFLNAFGLLIYVVLIEKHINKISNEYFKY